MQLIEENARRGEDQPEFELLDTGLFDTNRYFDVFVEYAKAAPDDILMLVTVHNRGPEAAKLTLLPQLCFRNIWSWNPNSPKPKLSADNGGVKIEHHESGNFRLDCDGKPALLFCENETNVRRLFGQPEAKGFFKDAFHEYVIAGKKSAVNPAQTGTKACALYELNVLGGTIGDGAIATSQNQTQRQRANRGTISMRFLLSGGNEADEFYAELQERNFRC